jgi:hypothetical protein
MGSAPKKWGPGRRAETGRQLRRARCGRDTVEWGASGTIGPGEGKGWDENELREGFLFCKPFCRFIRFFVVQANFRKNKEM